MTCQVDFSLMFPLHELGRREGGKGWILGVEKSIFIDRWSVFQRNKNIYFHLSFLHCRILYYELFLWTTGICMLAFKLPEVYLQWKWNQDILRACRPVAFSQISVWMVYFFLRVWRDRHHQKSICCTRSQCWLWLLPHWSVFFWRPQNWLSIWDHLFEAETAKIISLTPLKNKKCRHILQKFILL